MQIITVLQREKELSVILAFITKLEIRLCGERHILPKHIDLPPAFEKLRAEYLLVGCHDSIRGLIVHANFLCGYLAKVKCLERRELPFSRQLLFCCCQNLFVCL